MYSTPLVAAISSMPCSMLPNQAIKAAVSAGQSRNFSSSAPSCARAPREQCAERCRAAAEVEPTRAKDPLAAEAAVVVERLISRTCLADATASDHCHFRAKATPSQSHATRRAFGFAVAPSSSLTGVAVVVLCRAESPPPAVRKRRRLFFLIVFLYIHVTAAKRKVTCAHPRSTSGAGRPN